MAADRIQSILGNVVGSTGHRYDAKDSTGRTMDTAKIIANPSGGYLSVYHTGDMVNLATSTDLLTRAFLRTLDPQATQPTIAALPTGGFLTGVEFNDQAGSGGRLRLRHYADFPALCAAEFDREQTIARTLSACNEGTPNIYSVTPTPDIDNSVIDLGFHYHRNCRVDRQARGRLTDFSAWTAVFATDLDRGLVAAAAARGRSVGGNIGDRDSMTLDAVRYNLHEVQYRRNDFGSWRIYLYDWGTGSVEYLPVVTHGGSTAFANPTATLVTGPSGTPAVVVTLFVPTEGAAPGEAGELIFYRELRAAPAGPPCPPPGS